MSSFFLQLLGKPVLRDGVGVEVHLPTRKHLGLAVLLVLESKRRGVSRDRAIELLWPDVPHGRGRHSLSQGLSVIRWRLGPDVVSRGGDRLTLVANVTTDLDRLPPPACGVWDLTPLDRLEEAAGVEFAHWVESWRSRIRLDLRDALDAEIDRLRSSGNIGAVRERAEQLYHIDPQNHRAVHILAEHAADRGDYRGAIKLLEQHIEQQPQNAPPGATGHLQMQLSRIRSAQSLRITAPLSNRSPTSRATNNLVGRGLEFKHLHTAWRAAKTGYCLKVLISGPPGVGKTALLNRFAREAESDSEIAIISSCQNVARHIPFATLLTLIDALAAYPEIGEADPFWLGELSRCAPSLRARYPGIPVPTPASADTIRLSIAEAFHRALATVCGDKRIVLVLDDFENLDAASNYVLYSLTRRPSTFALSLIAAQQAEPPGNMNTGQQGHALSWDWDLSLKLAPLQDAESASLFRSLTDSPGMPAVTPAVLRKAVELSGGLPYLIHLLAADWKLNCTQSLLAIAANGGDTQTDWEPARTFATSFARHYNGLAAPDREIMEMLAVAGRPLATEELIQLTGLQWAIMRRAINDALTVGVLCTVADRITFRSAAHRTFIYHLINQDARRLLHARIGTALISPGEPNPTQLMEAFGHLEKAGAVEKAIEVSLPAASSAMHQGAVKQAEHILERAIALSSQTPPLPQVLLLLQLRNLQGRFSATMELYKRTRTYFATLEDIATGSRLYAHAMVRSRRIPPATVKRAVSRALHNAQLSQDERLISEALFVCAEHAAELRDWQGLALVRRASKRLSAGGSPGRELEVAQMTRGFCALSSGMYVNGYQIFRDVAQLLDHSGRRAESSRAWNGCGICLYGMGEYRMAKRAFHRAFRAAERIGDIGMLSNLASNLGACNLDIGEFDSAGVWYDRSLQYSEAAHPNPYETPVLTNYADYHLVTGDLQQASQAVRRAAAATAIAPQCALVSEVKLTTADILIAQGEPSKACDVIREVETLMTAKSRLHTPRPWEGFDSSHFARLVRFRAAMEGDTTTALRSPWFKADGPQTLASFIETVVFCEWLSETTTIPCNFSPNAEQLIRATGLNGTLMRMRRLGLTPTHLR